MSGLHVDRCWYNSLGYRGTILHASLLLREDPGSQSYASCGCRPDEARDAFDSGIVPAERFRSDGAAIVRSPNLLCRVGGSVYRWRRAVPALVGRVVYPLMPWRRLFRGGVRMLDASGASDSPPAQLEVCGRPASCAQAPVFTRQPC